MQLIELSNATTLYLHRHLIDLYKSTIQTENVRDSDATFTINISQWTNTLESAGVFPAKCTIVDSPRYRSAKPIPKSMSVSECSPVLFARTTHCPSPPLSTLMCTPSPSSRNHHLPRPNHSASNGAPSPTKGKFNYGFGAGGSVAGLKRKFAEA